MRTRTRKAKTNRIANILTAGLLTVCLAAGMMPGYDEAYGASDYEYNTPFSNTGRTTYTTNRSVTANLVVNGVDVSAYQSTSTNWVTAKAKGVDFAILRVTWTGYRKDTHAYKNKDSSFATNYRKAKAAGIMTGVYVFSQATTENEAANEANYAVSRLRELGIGPEDLELPVYMDYEFAGGTSGRLYGIKKATATKCAKAFCETIRNAGYQPGIYASKSFYDSYIDVSQLGSDVDIWCAQYWYKCAYTGTYSKWQYSSTAKIGSGSDGILSSSNNKVGYTDVNFWYIDRTRQTSAMTDIYAVTELNYTGGAVVPKFEIYNGSTLLTEGRDYTVSGIRNVAKGSNTAYAYIKGIGSYSGYALVPFTIGSGYKSHIGLSACAAADGGLVFGNRHLETTEYLVTFTDAEGNILSQEYYPEGTAASGVAVPEGYDFGVIQDVAAPVTYAAIPAVSGDPEDQPEPADDTTDNGQTDQNDQAADETEQTAGEIGQVADETDQATDATGQTTDGDQTTDVTGQTADGDQAPAGTAGETGDTDETAAEVTGADGAAQNGEVTAGDQTTGEGAADGDQADGETEPLPSERKVPSEETVYDMSIGTGSIGSYVRNVPSGLTVSAFLDALAVREGYEGDYTLSVIDGYYNKVNGTNALRTGMMLGVYKSGTLVGTADITVTGDSINDTGANYLSKAPAAKVTVSKTTIKKLKRYKKAFKVTVAKKSKAYVTGYQVRYSLKSDMSNAKIKTIGTKYSAVTKKITGLKKNRKYYVQVRSYKVVNGRKYYSAWSAKKTVKTK